MMTINRNDDKSDTGIKVDTDNVGEILQTPNGGAIEKISDEMYCRIPKENNISEHRGIGFVNDEIDIVANENIDITDAEEIANSIDGNIAGYISVTNSYQIVLNKRCDYDDITGITNELKKNNDILLADVNYLFEEEANFYPESDIKWAGIWDDNNPSGYNWGPEAIKATRAWDYRGKMNYVNVGVWDCCFMDNEDLTFTKTYFNYPDKCRAETRKDHGTHVAGTIASGFDNGKGIAGIMPKANLYGFSSSSSDERLNTVYTRAGETTFSYKLALSQLIGVDGCKVVNYSMGFPIEWKVFATYDSTWRRLVELNAKELENYLWILINNGYEFIICTTAGNDNDVKVRRDTLDIVKGWDSMITSTVSGAPDAKYNNLLTAIDLRPVKERIIVIGAARQAKNGYSITEWSNRGDRVDVMAPGEKIMSTSKGAKYVKMSGTSQASPHVAGLAAMLFGLDPLLTGDRCKQIIVDTADIPVKGCSQKMIDCEPAVATLLEEETEVNHAEFDFSKLDGTTFGLTDEDGSWGTYISVDRNGYFGGSYGIEGEEDYHFCEFTGRLICTDKLNEYRYRFKIKDFNIQGGDLPEPHGIRSGSTIEIYLPGIETNSLTKEIKRWIGEVDNKASLTFYVLYNMEEGFAFRGFSENDYEWW